MTTTDGSTSILTTKKTATKNSSRPSARSLYAALVRRASQCMIEGNDACVKKCTETCKRAFSNERALGRELALLKSLSESVVSSRPEADRFVTNARSVAATIDWKKADAEANAIARVLGESCEFAVADDTDKLLAEWRCSRPDVVRVTMLEECVVAKLQEKRDLGGREEHAVHDPLVERLMVAKFNERYVDALSPRQKTLLRELAFGTGTDAVAVEISIDEAHHAINVGILAAAEKEDHMLIERLADVVECLEALHEMPPQKAAEGCMRLLAIVDELSSRDE